MIQRSLVLCCILTSLLSGADFALRDGDTVVFYGDSITDQRLYTTFAESYVVTRFPKLRVRFVHSGWGGDRVSGGGGGPIDLRLQRDVIAYKPTVMTIMLGMNDARYKPFDEQLFHDFDAGFTHIIQTVKTALPGIRITAIQPSPYDDVTRAPLFDPGYNSVLVRYSSYLRELAKREKLDTADLNTGVVAALRQANAKDPAQAAKMIPDRVHPGPSGHLLMAEALLKAWNAPAVVTDVALGAQGAVTRTVGTVITEVERTGTSLTWAQMDNALPMPVDWKDSLIQLAADSSDFVQALDQELLQVAGLTAGTYRLAIDGETVGTYSAAQLAASINLAAVATPMLRQALDVAQLTIAHNNVHFARWRTVQVPTQKYALMKTEATMSTMDALEDELIATQRATAQPRMHRYSLTLQ